MYWPNNYGLLVGEIFMFAVGEAAFTVGIGVSVFFTLGVAEGVLVGVVGPGVGV